MTVHSSNRTRLSQAASFAIAIALAASPRVACGQFAIDKTELLLSSSSSAQRTGVLIVRNEGTMRGQAEIKVEDWDRAESGTNRFYEPGTIAQSCAKALKVFPATINLAAGEAQAVRISLDSLADSTLTNRECWSVVLVESTVPEKTESGRTLLYRLRTGVKVYAASNDLPLAGEVSDVSVHAAAADSAARDTVEVAFQNTGARHVVAHGRIEIRRPDNSTVAIVDLPAAYALPGSTMRVRATVPSLSTGRYVVLAVMDYGGNEIAAAQLEHEVKQ